VDEIASSLGQESNLLIPSRPLRGTRDRDEVPDLRDEDRRCRMEAPQRTITNVSHVWSLLLARLSSRLVTF